MSIPSPSVTPFPLTSLLSSFRCTAERHCPFRGTRHSQNTEITTAVSDIDSISKHRLSPYNTHSLISTFYLVSSSNALWILVCDVKLLDVMHLKPCSERPTQLNSTSWVWSGSLNTLNNPTQVNSAQLVSEFFPVLNIFSWVESKCQSVQSTRLNCTEWASVVTQFSSGCMMPTPV